MRSERTKGAERASQEAILAGTHHLGGRPRAQSAPPASETPPLVSLARQPSCGSTSSVHARASVSASAHSVTVPPNVTAASRQPSRSREAATRVSSFSAIPVENSNPKRMHAPSSYKSMTSSISGVTEDVFRGLERSGTIVSTTLSRIAYGDEDSKYAASPTSAHDLP